MFGVPRSNSVVASCSSYRDLFIFTRSCSELLGVHRSNSVVGSCSPLVAGTYSYLLGAARTCSELLGATLSLQVASSTGTYRYSYLLAATRSCSEQKCLSNQSHSKCTNGTVNSQNSQAGKYCKTWTRRQCSLLSRMLLT